MDSLTRARRIRWIALGAAAAALTAGLLLSILRPAREPPPEDRFVQDVIGHPYAQADPRTREALRRRWRSFPPETRRRIFEKIARARLDALRLETAKLSPAERSRRIQNALRAMRERRRRLTPQQRRAMQQRLRSPEAREMVRNVLHFYRNQLTARERAELDPLVHEWLRQLEQLGQGP